MAQQHHGFLHSSGQEEAYMLAVVYAGGDILESTPPQDARPSLPFFQLIEAFQCVRRHADGMINTSAQRTNIHVGRLPAAGWEENCL